MAEQPGTSLGSGNAVSVDATALLDDLLEPVLLLRRDRHAVAYANPAAAALFGRAPETLIGHSYLDLVDPPERDASERRLAILWRKGPRLPVAHRHFLRPDGSLFTAETTARRIDIGGQPLVQLVLRDITASLASAWAEQAAVRRLNGIMNALADGVVALDEDGRIEDMNPAAERLFGFSIAWLRGRDISVLMPQPFRGEHPGYLQRFRETGEARIIGHGREVIGLRRDGTTFAMALNVSQVMVPERDADGSERQRRLFIGTVRDVTAQRIAENALRYARGQAEMANRVKTEFLSNMSHELRTPLNAIIGFGELLGGEYFGSLNDKQRDYVRDILDSGRHLLGMVNMVLEMSKIEAGRYLLDERDWSLAAIVEQALSGLRPDIAARSLQVDLAVPADLPLLRADRRCIEQVLMHLLTNAVKFTDPGGRIAVAGGIEESGHLALTVRDTGIGIPADKLVAIFEPFQQSDASTARKHEGTGLGLAIARNFMELHGGTLELDSREGEGTAACARFPASRVLGGTTTPMTAAE